MTPDWLIKAPVTHRGLHDLQAGVPENSLAAMEASCRAGLPMEIDVRQLGDGTVVVQHDANLDRLCGDSRRLSAIGREDLATLKLCNTDERIPTLADALDLIAGRVPVLIEIKNERHHAGALEQAVYKTIRSYQDEMAVISFNPLSLAWFAHRHPHITRGQTASHLPYLRLNYLAPVHAGLKHLAFNRLSKPDFILYQHRGVAHRAPRRARRRGLPVIAFTVTSQAEQTEAMKHADNVIFEGFTLAKSTS